MSGANIIKKKQNNWTKSFQLLEDFREKTLESKEGIPEKQTIKIKEKAIEILNKCPNPKSNKKKQEVGLVMGDVQSGKTLSFTSLAVSALENGYEIVILLAGTKQNLWDQNHNRIKDCLYYSRQYAISKNDNALSAQSIKAILNNSLNRHLIITSMKNTNGLNRLKKTIQDLIKIHPLKSIMIIDDEADQASMNTKDSENDPNKTINDPCYQTSSTYQALYDLQSQTTDIVSYIQYTATPQGPIFIALNNILSPSFVVMLESGDGYVGSQEFFVDNSKQYLELIKNIEIISPSEYNIQYSKGLTNTQKKKLKSNLEKQQLNKLIKNVPPPSLTMALIDYFIGVADAYVKNDGAPTDRKETRSMLIHPHSNTISHDLFYKYVSDIIQNNFKPSLSTKCSKFKKELNIRYNDFAKNNPGLSKFSEIYKFMSDVVKDTRIIIANSTINRITGVENVSAIDFEDYYNVIVIGGNTLDRGFTIEGLTVTYMPRSIGGGNSDTIQQRCRFFGYKKKYLDLCKIWLPAESKSAYIDYHKHEIDLKKRIADFYQKNPGGDFKQFNREVLLSDQLKLSRSNIFADEYKRYKINEGSKEWSDFHVLDKEMKMNLKLVDKLVSHCSNIGLTYLNSSEKFTPNQKHVSGDFKLDKNIKSFIVDYEVKSNSNKITQPYIQQKLLGETEICLVFISSNEKGVSTIVKGAKKTIRERTWDRKDNKYQLPMGESTKFKVDRTQYPGDREYKNKDLWTIQIHRFLDKESLKKACGLYIIPPENSPKKSIISKV